MASEPTYPQGRRGRLLRHLLENLDALAALEGGASGQVIVSYGPSRKGAAETWNTRVTVYGPQQDITLER